MFRHKISTPAIGAGDLFSGEIKCDKSYFGGTRKGKRRRGAAGKTPVFGDF